MDRNSWFHEQKAETERLGSHTEVQRTCTHWMGWASEHLHYLCRVELIPVEATSAKSDIDMLPWLQRQGSSASSFTQICLRGCYLHLQLQRVRLINY